MINGPQTKTASLLSRCALQLTFMQRGYYNLLEVLVVIRSTILADIHASIMPLEHYLRTRTRVLLLCSLLGIAISSQQPHVPLTEALMALFTSLSIRLAPSYHMI